MRASTVAVFLAVIQVSSAVLAVPLDISDLEDLLDKITNVVTDCSEVKAGIGKRCVNQTTIEICAGGSGLGEVNCKPERPVCWKEAAKCVERPPPYSCPAADGYFPDLKDCKRFYICVRGRPEENACPEGPYVYADELHSCAAQSVRRPCRGFRCAGKPAGRAVPYSGDPRYYALCDGKLPSEIFDCGEGMAFVEAEGLCNVRCLAEGNVPDPEGAHPRKYYQCTRTTAGNFAVKQKWCPSTTVFHPFLRHCVPEPQSLLHTAKE